MKKSGITRRQFLGASAAGSASLMAVSYSGFNAWAAKEKPKQEISWKRFRYIMDGRKLSRELVDVHGIAA